MARRYMGQRIDKDNVEVTVDGRPLLMRLELRNHSPTGFEWGYGGSGPAQLALAIVCDVLDVPPGTREPRMFEEHVDERVRRALNVYQLFKEDHVAKWPSSWWIVDEDVMRCIERVEEEDR